MRSNPSIERDMQVPASLGLACRSCQTLGPMSTVYDTIVWLQSRSTGLRFPIVVFTGDTDMVTNGWASLTSIERPEIVVTQMTGAEFLAAASDTKAFTWVENRVNGSLNRTDLRCCPLIRAEEIGPSAAGLSFQEFRKVYRPPKLFFRDIHDPASLAHEIGCTSRAEFERSGGSLVVLA